MDRPNTAEAPTSPPLPQPQPGKRPSRAVLRERLDETQRLLRLTLRKGEIKRRLRERFGPLSARTIERYLGDARQRLVEEAGGNRAGRGRRKA